MATGRGDLDLLITAREIDEARAELERALENLPDGECTEAQRRVLLAQVELSHRIAEALLKIVHFGRAH